MPCFSHPEKLLISHLKNVRDIGFSVFQSKRLKSNFNFGIDNNDFEKAIEIMLYYHDLGKATRFFQDYLNSSLTKTKYEGDIDLTHHALISAVFAAYKIKVEIDNPASQLLFSIIVFASIRKHHGDLESIKNLLTLSKNNERILKMQWENMNFTDFPEINPEIFSSMLDFTKDLLFAVDDIEKKFESYFLLNFFFSLLTYSDKSEVILGNKATDYYLTSQENLITNFKEKTFFHDPENLLDQIRDEIYDQASNSIINRHQSGSIFSINVPTGSGKTLTVINTALKMLNQDNTLNRIIYALPYTSIIDQTNFVLESVFQQNELDPNEYIGIHHHLAEPKITNNELYLEGDKAQFIVENWDKPFILTTFWQVFHSLVAKENSQLRKFHNLANSIIILDEIQTLPHKYWLLIHDILISLAQNFNCKIIFLTATMPLIFREDQNEIIPLIDKSNRNRFFSQFSRYNIESINHLEDMDMESLYAIAQDHIEQEKGKSFLFVFNTVKSSILFYRKLKQSFPDEEFIYLSTNILPVDRKERIRTIKESTSRKIVVSTQLIEAGVDIDLDIVYRDFAPLDSIVQTAGRCNRNNRNIIGKVHLFKLINEKGKNDCNYIYQSVTLDATRKLFATKTIVAEHEILEIINQYYEAIKNKSSSNESLEIIQALINLDYDKIIEKFKLIEEIPSFLVFIEKDNMASELLKKFYGILDIKDNFERKNEFLKIKGNFYQYVLSLKINNQTKSTFASFEQIKNFRIIEKDFADSLYKNDIGFSEDFNDF